MANFRDAFPSKYLKADDLAGPVAVEVDSVDYEDVGTGQRQERKLVARFVGRTKGLVLNMINAETIAEITGTADYEQWPGHSVELYPTKTEFQGKRVPCTRIREVTSKTSRPKGRAAPEEPDLEDVAF